MKIFEVTIHSWKPERVHATKARIAINKVMQCYKESAFTPCAKISVQCVGTVHYSFIVKANLRDEKGATSYVRLPLGPYKKRGEAEEAAGAINTTARDAVNPTCFSARVYRLDEEGRVSR